MAEGNAGRSGLRSAAADLAPKLLLTVFAAAITALLIPWITGKWQDHKQQLELRTTIASDMSRAYTDVIVNGRFVSRGLVYSGSTVDSVDRAASQTVWSSALHDWLVESGRLTAELSGRYPGHAITREWREYVAAVSAYMLIGAGGVPAERVEALATARRYLGDDALAWDPLSTKRPKTDLKFRASFTALGSQLIARGDDLVQEELTLEPRV
jgi:hypothetical protein